jgi:outer membrane PBP1 activator LpoA protein
MMKSASLFLLILLLAACTAPGVRESTSVGQVTLETDNRDIDRLLLEAGRAAPPASTELKLSAAALALRAGDPTLARRIIDSIEAAYSNEDTTREYSFLSAELALLEGDPRLAISLLEDPRLQRIRLDSRTQLHSGRLRAEAYLQGRSYLASARELIYIDRLIPGEQREENHEKIFQTLMRLDESALSRQAEQSITTEIRGWLSLAAMTKKFQYDPLRQLNALKDWQQVWVNHPAAVMVPSSLRMLSKIVADRPEHVALILPLNGDLGALGRAIRDGYIAAHYQLTPDTSLRIYDSSQADILELTSRAVSEGAEIIIGPLDRERVTRLARQPLKVPVVALNRTLSGEINPNLYQFGLAPEDESLQVARQVAREGRLKGIVVVPDTPWGERNFNAFTDGFIREGGIIIDSARFTDLPDYSDLVKDLLNIDSSEQRAANLRRITGERFEFSARRRQDIDFVFLLSTTTQARGINPTIAFFYAEDIPVYATSHVHTAGTSRLNSRDLNGIRFCDIPWKLTDDDPLQMLINNTWEESSGLLSSFYALGVDVHRLYPRLQQLREFPDEKIFGSTGILSLSEENIVRRELMWAQFRDGEVHPVPMILTGPE